MLNKRETSTAFIELHDNIVKVRIKEDANLTIDSLHEQFAARNEMLGHKPFGILVDGNNHHYATSEAREYMAKYVEPNRVATAIISSNLAVRLLANVFIRISRPKTPTRLFFSEKEAMEWLKTKIEDSGRA